MKKVVSSIAVAAGLTLGASSVHADMHPGVQGLNDLLIQKGIITKEEVEAQAKKHSLNITGYIQVQGAVIDNNDAKGTGDNNPLADQDGFRVRRAKLAASGNAYEHVKFKLEVNFAGTPVLDDAWIEDDRLSYFIGKVGQFKAPFSLEELTSATEILTIERSEVVKQIAPEREQGISFSGKGLAGGLLDYSIGAFNSGPASVATTYSVGSYNNAGKNKTANDNDQLMYVGRVVVKPAGWVNVGVNGLTSQDSVGSTAVGRTSYGVDLQIKNPKRGCSLQGEYLRQWLKDTADRTTTSDGFYVQAGHYLVPKHLEALVKYEEYDSNKDAANQDDIRWATVGLNYYIYGHDAKLMVNYVFKDERQNSFNNDTFLTQLQLRF